MLYFPKILDTLQRSMNAATLRHQVIANNIANVNVPGFQGAEVTFEDKLQEAINRSNKGETLQGLTTDERHIPIGSAEPEIVRPTIVPMSDHHMRQDGNTIDVDDQMSKLSANQLWYQALVRSMSDEMARLRTVIMEGRR